VGILRFMWRLLRGFWDSHETSPNGIDYHKWESKVEILRNLSSRRD
jgi:hypothetical protein